MIGGTSISVDIAVGLFAPKGVIRSKQCTSLVQRNFGAMLGLCAPLDDSALRKCICLSIWSVYSLISCLDDLRC